MNLHVTFRNLNPRDEIRRRGEALFAKLERFVDPATEGQMIVSIEAHEAIVEVIVSEGRHVSKALERSEDLRTAMDKAFHTVEEQLRRRKDRRNSGKRARRREPETGFVVEPSSSDADDRDEVGAEA